MTDPTHAAFVPALQCPKCYDVSSIGDTLNHPRGAGVWCCQRCGYAYPNTAELKHFFREGVALFVAQDMQPDRPELAAEEEAEEPISEVQPT